MSPIIIICRFACKTHSPIQMLRFTLSLAFISAFLYSLFLSPFLYMSLILALFLIYFIFVSFLYFPHYSSILSVFAAFLFTSLLICILLFMFLPFFSPTIVSSPSLSSFLRFNFGWHGTRITKSNADNLPLTSICATTLSA